MRNLGKVDNHCSDVLKNSSELNSFALRKLKCNPEIINLLTSYSS